MPFCQSCGSPLDPSGICPRCGPAGHAAPPPPPGAPPQYAQNQYQQPPPQQFQQPPQQFGQQYPPGYGYPPPRPQSPLGMDIGACLKGFFSANPTQSLAPAVASRAPIWAILGGAYALVATFAIMLIPSSMEFTAFLTAMFHSEYATAAFALNAYPYGMMLLIGLLIGSGSFFLMALLAKCIFAANRINIPFVPIMNIVSASSIFITLTLSAGILFNFFFPQATVIFIIVGLVGSTIMLYIGIQQAGSFQKSPFWLYVAFLLAAIAVLVLLMYPIYNAVMEGAISSLRNRPLW